MRTSKLLRAAGHFCLYGTLVLFSFWVPFKWGPALAPPDASRHVSPRTSELCGLALTPPPRMRAADHAGMFGWQSERPERLTLRLDLPLPPLARQWQLPVKPRDEVLSRVATRTAGPPSRSESLGNALSALDLGARPEQSANEQASGVAWQRPTSLISLLTRLQENPYTKDWATRGLQEVERLTSAAMTHAQRQAVLEEMLVAINEVEPLIQSFEDASLASQLRRAGFALSRRVAVWQAALAVDLRQMQDAEPPPQLQELAQCMAEVNELIQGPAGAGWRAYLMLESLGKLSDTPATQASVEGRALARRVLQRLDYARTLPQQQRFVSERPLADLAAQLRQWSAEEVDTSLLLARLEQYEQTGRPGLGHAVAEDLQRLAFSPHEENQALAHRVDELYRNCNLRVAVSREMINRFLPEQTPKEAPVRDMVLGVPVRGRSTTTNELAVRLLPSSERLRLELSATGFVQSTTVSQRGPIAFNSRSESTYTARKVLEFGAREIEAQPAEAEADSNSRLRSVQSDYDDVPILGSILQEYAIDGYRQRRNEARHEVQGKVAAQAREKLDRLAQEGFGKVHKRFVDQVMVPLDRLDLAPSYTESRTDEVRFTLRTRLAGPDQLAANTPRPRALANSLLSAQVHESAANNILDHLGLAGKRFTAEELRRHLVERFNLGKPIEPGSSDDYAVTFGPSDPLRVRFRAGRLELSLDIALLESGSRSWQNFTVFVNYKPVAHNRGVELVRDGTIGLEGERLGMQSQFVLRGTFGRIFSEDRRVTWLADWLEQDKRLAGLEVTQCSIDDGWLGLSIGPRRAGGALAAQ